MPQFGDVGMEGWCDIGMPMAEQSLMSEKGIPPQLEDCCFLIRGHMSAAKSLARLITSLGFFAVSVFALNGILLDRDNQRGQDNAGKAAADKDPAPHVQ